MRFAPLVVLTMCCGCGSAKTQRAPGEDATAQRPELAMDAPTRASWRAQVTVVGVAPRSATQLEIVGDEIWAASRDEVIRYPLAGGEGQRRQFDVAAAAHLHLDGQSITAVSLDSGHIYRIDPESSQQETLGKSPELTSDAGIHRLGGDLVWATKHGIMAMPIDGKKIRTLVKKVSPRGPLSTRGDALYFHDGEEIVAALAKNGSTRTLAPTTDRVAWIDANAERVFWMGGSQIASVPVSGGSVSVHAQPSHPVEWVAVAEDRLVWLEADASDGDAVVWTTLLPEGPPRELLRLPLASGAATIHAGRLYFTTEADGQPVLVSLALD